MPYDSEGNFTRVHNWEDDRINDISIDSLRMDEDLDDIANGLSQAFLRNGNSAMERELDMGGFRVRNVADGTSQSDVVTLKQLNESKASTNTYTDNAISTMLSKVYPVGSIYIGTQNACPLSTLIVGSQWSLVAANKALWTGSGNNANKTIEAGLPNITGRSQAQDGYIRDSVKSNGAISELKQAKGSSRSGDGGNSAAYFEFNASWSNDIYGKSNTVQPPAYVVNVWRRTA